MLYVGLTENHKESATMFANIVGAQVISQHRISNSSGDVSGNNDSSYWSEVIPLNYIPNVPLLKLIVLGVLHLCKLENV